MADSATIRLAMATTPREGSRHCSWAFPCSIGIVLMIFSASLESGIGIFRMLQVPQRTAAGDLWISRKVIGRLRRRNRPFERPRIPRIRARLVAPEIGVHHVVHQNQYRNRLDKTAD